MDLPPTLSNDTLPALKNIPSGTRLKVNCSQEYKEGNHSITCKDGGWSEVEPPCESRSNPCIHFLFRDNLIFRELSIISLEHSITAYNMHIELPHKKCALLLTITSQSHISQYFRLFFKFLVSINENNT